MRSALARAEHYYYDNDYYTTILLLLLRLLLLLLLLLSLLLLLLLTPVCRAARAESMPGEFVPVPCNRDSGAH